MQQVALLGIEIQSPRKLLFSQHRRTMTKHRKNITVGQVHVIGFKLTKVLSASGFWLVLKTNVGSSDSEPDSSSSPLLSELSSVYKSSSERHVSSRIDNGCKAG